MRQHSTSAAGEGSGMVRSIPLNLPGPVIVAGTPGGVVVGLPVLTTKASDTPASEPAATATSKLAKLPAHAATAACTGAPGVAVGTVTVPAIKRPATGPTDLVDQVACHPGFAANQPVKLDPNEYGSACVPAGAHSNWTKPAPAGMGRPKCLTRVLSSFAKLMVPCPKATAPKHNANPRPTIVFMDFDDMSTRERQAKPKEAKTGPLSRQIKSSIHHRQEGTRRRAILIGPM